MFGIDVPIFAFSHCRDVVAEVSKVGGMGVLGVTGHSPEMLEIELKWIEEEVGDAPYGVDVLLPAKFIGSDEGGLTRDQLEAMIPQDYRDFVDDLLRRYDIPELPPDERTRWGGGGSLLGSTSDGVGDLLEVALAHRIAVVANALGPPPPSMIEAAKERGVKVAALAGKVQHAERHVAAGVDLVVAQGYEAGGHTGEIGTMVLIPEVVDAVDVPVVAAGGIASGRQMAAALALGAEGVWCGSVWLTTEEAETHPVVKDKFLGATSSDTARSRSATGKPARQLKSAWTEEWDKEVEPLGMPLQPMLVGAAQHRIQRAAQNNEGARELVNYFVGQVVGSMNEVKTTRQVVFEMIDELIDAGESVTKALAE